jgi:predicted Zn-dependent peptidase
VSIGRIVSWVILAAAALLVLAIGVQGLREGWWAPGPSAPRPRAVKEEPIAERVVLPQPAVVEAEVVVDAGASPPEARLEAAWDFFGGQPIEWWTAELNASRGSSPEQHARHTLLQRRAKALGLVVSEAEGQVKVEAPKVMLSDFGRRKKGERVGSIPAPNTQAIISQADVRRLRPSPAHANVIMAPGGGPRSTAYFEFEAGTSDDGTTPGLTLLALHAVISANARQSYGDLISELYASGSELSFDVATHRSHVMLSAPNDRFPQLLSKVTNLLFYPRLAPGALSGARRRAGHHNSAPDMLEALMHTLQMSSKDAPEADRVEETYSNTELETIVRHARKVFCPANATIVVTGAFDPGRVRQTLGELRGGVSLAGSSRDGAKVSGAYTVPSRSNLELFAFPIALDSEESHASALLFASLLEDFVQTRARRLGLAYTVQASPVHSDWSDFVLLSVPLGDEAPSHTGEELQRQLSQFIGTAITDEAVKRNQQAVLRSLEELQEQPEALSLALAASVRSGSSFGESTRVALSKVTREELTKLATAWMKPSATIRVDLSPRFDRFERTETK